MRSGALGSASQANGRYKRGRPLLSSHRRAGRCPRALPVSVLLLRGHSPLRQSRWHSHCTEGALALGPSNAPGASVGCCCASQPLGAPFTAA